MAQSLSKVYVHITFSTKTHQPLIVDVVKTSLFEYLGRICKGMECNLLKIGGHRDHVHILCMLSRKVPQMKLLEEIKKQSSRWIKTKGPAYSGFYWQDGYGIFSVNPIEAGIVVRYIENQQEYHKKLTFKDEFLAFLKTYKVEYDERYVWD